MIAEFENIHVWHKINAINKKLNTTIKKKPKKSKF
jgi:hypothetical protein